MDYNSAIVNACLGRVLPPSSNRSSLPLPRLATTLLNTATVCLVSRVCVYGVPTTKWVCLFAGLTTYCPPPSFGGGLGRSWHEQKPTGGSSILDPRTWVLGTERPSLLGGRYYMSRLTAREKVANAGSLSSKNCTFGCSHNTGMKFGEKPYWRGNEGRVAGSSLGVGGWGWPLAVRRHWMYVYIPGETRVGLFFPLDLVRHICTAHAKY